jgi:aspartate kinase
MNGKEETDMTVSPKISTSTDITLVTLQNCPSELGFVTDVFRQIGQLGVDVDMISLSPAHGAYTSVSFTIADNDLDKILSFTCELRDKAKIKAIVSSGNCKISVYDPNMVHTPGIAAQVFEAVSSAHADIRLITTSEIDISMLITASDFPEVMKVMEKGIHF